MYLPKHTGEITITSVYGGKDYRTSGAQLGIAKCLYFYGDYKIENINMVSEADNMFIACNYNNVTFGDNIKSTLAAGKKTYPLILVGYNVALGDAFEEDLSLHGECNITVNSGSWVYIRGGNRRAKAEYPNFGSDKDAVLNITINGGEFVNKGNNLTAGTGMGGFDGTLNFTINGGTFLGDVFAVGRSGTNTTNTTGEMTGTINMIVNGGTFQGGIKMTQPNDSTTKVTGTVNLTIKASLKDKASGFTNVTVK